MTDTLPRRAPGQPHREYIAELHAAGVRYPHDAKRSVRRALSRDVSRAMAGPNLKPPANGAYADLVNMRIPMTVRVRSRESGQMRINVKRLERAEFWRTVKIRVSVQGEPYFLPSLHKLGHGVRILGRTVLQDWFAVDYDVHLPGIPVGAVRAEPVYKSVFNGEYYDAHLDYVVWYDADGHAINAETPQQIIEAAS